MISDTASFQKNADDFVSAYSAIPADALSYKPAGDDYTVGGLLVHVIDIMKKYSKALDQILDPSRPEVVHSAHRISPHEDTLIREGVHEADRASFLKELEELQSRFMKRVEALSDAQYAAKVPVLYDNATDPYPTSPADLLGWLKDHYAEHVTQIHKLVEEWKKQTS